MEQGNNPLHRYQDCYAELQGNLLVIGNDKIERSWELSGGTLLNKSLINKAEEDEWLKTPAADPMFKLPFPYTAQAQAPIVRFTSGIDDDLSVGKPHLLVTMELEYPELCVKLETRVYPETALLRHMLSLKSVQPQEEAGAAHPYHSQSNGRPDHEHDPQPAALLLDANNKQTSHAPADYLDMLTVSDLHCTWKTVALRDQTDMTNNLLREEHGLLYPNEKRWAEGNLLFVHKSLKDSGLLWIKESPSKAAHIHYGEGDFRFVGTNLYMAGTGIRQSDLETDNYVSIYGCTVGLFRGGEYGALQLLRQYHNSIRELKPERDIFIMCNTWGDRSKDGRIGEAFILSELDAASKLGITHYQIDDGWQQGATANSVVKGGRWSDYYSVEQFWGVHKERFPRGLEPVVQAAEERGIRLGLWFSPDSHDDFAHWEQDAERLIDLYRRYGVRYFKLDGINIRSKRGEANLIEMLRKVIRETGGAVYFNQDVTAQLRLGYFRESQYFGYFLENRYTDFGSYYPHWSLRNLWTLSKYIPAHKLQIEFLNVERNAAKYGDHPLSPSSCGIAYAFAAAMFANPLAWMEVSGLSDDSRRILGGLIGAYKQVQHRIMSGHILPIGEEPSGTGWTGLQSVVNDREGYLLLFREWNSREEGIFKLWNVSAGRLELRLLASNAGKGSSDLDSLTGREDASSGRPPELAIVDANGCMTYKLEKPLTFALLQYTSL